MPILYDLPLPSNFFARLLALIAAFSLFWIAYHLLLKRIVGSKRKAADLNSFSYCVAIGLVWNMCMIYRGIFNTSNFWKNPFSCPLVGVTDLYVEIYFIVQMSYNLTDLFLDHDPNFILHHILCIAGSLTPLLRRFDMASGMVVNLFLAELGGVPYHFSRMTKNTFLEAFMRRVFLYLYGGSRLCCYLPMALFGAIRFFQVGWTSNVSDSLWNFWCVLASFWMVWINMKWFLHHWANRHKYNGDENNIVGVPSPKNNGLAFSSETATRNGKIKVN
eukprot:m.7110 g.7110  ORF g.7110 m.7110 type:complete len:275 (+) comp17798_c0_seq2:366-1190(+)